MKMMYVFLVSRNRANSLLDLNFIALKRLFLNQN